MTWQVESQAYGISSSQGAPDSTYNSHAHAVSNHTSDAWGVGVGSPEKDGPVEDLFINPQWALTDSIFLPGPQLESYALNPVGSEDSHAASDQATYARGLGVSLPEKASLACQSLLSKAYNKQRALTSTTWDIVPTELQPYALNPASHYNYKWERAPANYSADSSNMMDSDSHWQDTADSMPRYPHLNSGATESSSPSSCQPTSPNIYSSWALADATWNTLPSETWEFTLFRPFC